MELGEPVERSGRHRLDRAEDRIEVLVTVDDDDDARQRAALVEIRRQGLGLHVEVGQQRSAPVELGGEHDDHPGDRLEVVAGRHGGAVRQFAQRAERPRSTVDHEEGDFVRRGTVDRRPRHRAQGGRLARTPTTGDQQAAALLEVEHGWILGLGGRIVEHAERDVAASAAPLGGVRRQLDRPPRQQLGEHLPPRLARWRQVRHRCAHGAEQHVEMGGARRTGLFWTAFRHGFGDHFRGDWCGRCQRTGTQDRCRQGGGRWPAASAGPAAASAVRRVGPAHLSTGRCRSGSGRASCRPSSCAAPLVSCGCLRSSSCHPPGPCSRTARR